MTLCSNQNAKIPQPSPLENLEAQPPLKNRSKPLAATDFSEADQARFWSKVKIAGPDECWPRTIRGYGHFRMGNRLLQAHRVALVISGTSIPEGMLACHRCDNPPCCNPRHLFLGTFADNNYDKQSKGRAKYPERAAHSLLMIKVAARGDKNGSRLYPERRPRGERCNMAKLTASQVIEIRAIHSAGGIKQKLAKQFGVSRQAIGYIVSRKNWKHV